MGDIIYFDIAAICIMAVVLLSKGIRKKLKDFQSEVLAAMILGNFLLALTDIFSAWLPGMNVPGASIC